MILTNRQTDRQTNGGENIAESTVFVCKRPRIMLGFTVTYSRVLKLLSFVCNK